MPWLFTYGILVPVILCASTSFADLDDKVTQSFPAEAGGQLVVDADRGSINIKGGEESSVVVEVIRHATGNHDAARKTLKEHVVTLSKEGARVVASSVYQAEGHTFVRHPELQVKYLITLPRKLDVDVKTGGGSVSIGTVSGDVRVRTSGGSLSFTRVDGAISASTAGGNISVSGSTGKADVTTGGGSIKVADFNGELAATTLGGPVRADRVTGRISLKSNGGSIEATGISGQIKAVTSGGRVKTSIVGQPTGDCYCSGSAGVTIVLAEGAAVDVDARAGAGRIVSEFAIGGAVAGNQKKKEVVGKINGGGPMIKAVVRAGNIQLQKRKADTGRPNTSRTTVL